MGYGLSVVGCRFKPNTQNPRLKTRQDFRSHDRLWVMGHGLWVVGFKPNTKNPRLKTQNLSFAVLALPGLIFR